MAHKTAILERDVDVARLFGEYTRDTLPTRYLTSYTPTEKIKNLDTVAHTRDGKIWPSTERNSQYERNQRQADAVGVKPQQARRLSTTREEQWIAGNHTDSMRSLSTCSAAREARWLNFCIHGPSSGTMSPC
jgi:hypothetical protein